MRTAAIQQESSQTERDTPGRGWCQVITVLVAAIASLLVAGSAYGQALAPCRGVATELNARCGSVTVPLDRANPGLATTQVAFALVPRRDAARPSLGTLVGPGNAGSALIDRPADVLPSFGPLLDRRDLVLIDPRGTGRSDPIACRALGKVGLGFTAATRINAIGACGRELGPRVGAYGNAAIADDMDAVRAALGVERLDLFGSSYGTYLMTVYAARHPDHVRSVVLDAGYPIDYDPWGLDRLAAARRSIAGEPGTRRGTDTGVRADRRSAPRGPKRPLGSFPKVVGARVLRQSPAGAWSDPVGQ